MTAATLRDVLPFARATGLEIGCGRCGPPPATRFVSRARPRAPRDRSDPRRLCAPGRHSAISSPSIAPRARGYPGSAGSLSLDQELPASPLRLRTTRPDQRPSYSSSRTLPAGWVEHDSDEIWETTREFAAKRCDAGVEVATSRHGSQTIWIPGVAWDRDTGDHPSRARRQDRRTSNRCD